MRRCIFFLVTFCLVTFYACRSSKPIESYTQWVFKLTKGGGGVSKAYVFEVNQNGNYQYRGKHNVKHLGIKNGIVTPGELARIDSLITLVNWPEKDTTFGTSSEDSPRKEMMYFNGLSKVTVYCYRGEPLAIRNLEQFIDKIIGKDDF